MTTMGQKKKQLPQTAPAFSHAVIVYPYGTRRVTTLRDNEYIGIRPAELNRIRLEPAANLERYVILAPVSFAPADYKLHCQLRAIDHNILLSQLNPGMVAPHIGRASVRESMGQYG